jgi:hypothetical protein
VKEDPPTVEPSGKSNADQEEMASSCSDSWYGQCTVIRVNNVGIDKRRERRKRKKK